MRSPSYPIIEAMLAPALAIDANTRNRLGVVLNFLKARYEITVRTMAAMERPAPVRSIVMRVLMCSVLSFDPSSLLSMMAARYVRYGAIGAVELGRR